MIFRPSEEQVMLRDMVSRYLRENYPAAGQRTTSGHDPQLWRAFAEELAILGAPFSENDGGLGGNPHDTMIILTELGRALVAEPFLGSVVIGGGLLRRGGTPFAAELLHDLIQGKVLVALAYAERQGRYNPADVATTARREGSGFVLNGHKAVVVGTPSATHLIVTARTAGEQRERNGISLFLVEAAATAGLSIRNFSLIDGTGAGEVLLDNVVVPPEALLGPSDDALPIVEAVLDEAIAGLCAEACGVLGVMLDDTLIHPRFAATSRST